MKLLLDTNRNVDLARGDASLRDLVEQADQVFMPFIVLGELRAGFVRGSRRQENERLLKRFLSEPNVAVLFADMTTTRIYADVLAMLYDQATPIPTNDIWIAALALQHDLVLCTRDEHFKRVRGLNLI